MKKVEIYTDGACSGNPGPGGWGALLIYGKHKKEIYGGEKETTNNRMEITAAIKALQSLTKACEVTLYTDSNYVKKGITEWIHGWKEKNWKSANKKPVKNADLWKKLDKVQQQHKIKWVWVKAHDGNPGNEKADELARMGVEKVKI